MLSEPHNIIEFVPQLEMYAADEDKVLFPFLSEMQKIWVDGGIQRFEEPILTVEEYFSEKGVDLRKYALKIERLNKAVGFLNQTKSVTDYKRAVNEVSKIIKGDQHKYLPFPEPEYAPGLINI